VALMLGASGAAQAIQFDYNPGCTITGVDPTDCFGGIYEITLQQTATGGAFDSYEVWMGVDTTGGLTFLSPGEQGYLVNLEFKAISGAVAYSNLQLLGGSDGTWVFGDGPLNGTGCSGVNGDFACMLETTSNLNAIGDYDVGVSFDVAAGSEVMLHHYGIRFVDEQGNGNQVSLPIPEAGSPLLFAAGLLVVGVALRRRV
jgi:hypothetical protein